MSALSSAARWAGSWRAALRISRREVLRHKARNTLIVAMLALPVAGATAAETFLNTSQNLSATEQVARTVGGTDAYIGTMAGGPLVQSTSMPVQALPASALQSVQSAQSVQQVGSGAPPPQPTAQQLASDAAVKKVLPDATLLPEYRAFNVFVHGPSGYAVPAYYRLDFSDPALGGAFDLLSGRLPHASDEVDVSPRAAAVLGAGIGSTISLPASSANDAAVHPFTVVGIMRQPTSATQQAVYALPGAPPAVGEQPAGWFVLDPGGVTWAQVRQLNAAGYPVDSRDVTLDPPPASQVPYNIVRTPAGGVAIGTESTAVVGIVVGIALLEVVLLAGPAFAVSARRREREYAMLGATGADSRQVRRIVLADGLVLGAVAGMCGALTGFAVAAALLPFAPGHLGFVPGHVHVDVSRVLAVAALSMALGLCSALVPARGAARRNIMATLSGRRAVDSRRQRAGRVVLGLILIPAGLLGVIHARHTSPASQGLYVVAGIALVEIGAILCTTTVIRLVARAGGFLPLGPRLALRDSARHTGRTTPAVAAMFVAVAGAVAAGTWFESSLTQSRQDYHAMLRPNQVAAAVSGAQQAQQVEAKLATILPIGGSMLSPQMSIQYANAAGTDEWSVMALQSGQTSVSLWGQSDAEEVVGGPQMLEEVTGIDDAQADAALEHGGIVVFEPGIVHDGRVSLLRSHTQLGKDGQGETTSVTRVTLPAAYLDPGTGPDPGLVIAPSAAAKVAVPGSVSPNLFLDLRTHITTTQLYAADQLLDQLGVPSGLTVEDGFTTSYDLANVVVLLVALALAIGAAAIATGLALADGRADQETLTAVGGSPGTRRWLAGSTALVVTGLGVLIGVPVGFAIAAGLIRVNSPAAAAIASAQKPMALIVPWLDLGVLVLALPCVTALAAGLLSRSRTPRAGRFEF